MKKICIVSHSLNLGGATKSMLDLLDMLKEQYEVLPCIPNTAFGVGKYLKEQGIPYYKFRNPVPTFNYYSGSSPLFLRSSIKQLMKFFWEKSFVEEILSLKPDAVFFNSIVTSLSARRIGGKVVKLCIVRETFRNSILNVVYKKILDNHFQGVCFIAENELKYLNLTKTKTVVIPDCLNNNEIRILSKEEACQQEGLDGKKFNILFMGGLDPIKGLDIALQAICLLGEEYHLLVCGYIDVEMINLKKIFKRIYNLSYFRFMLRVRRYLLKATEQNRVSLLGFRKETFSLFSACDVVLFPSNKAHQPRPGIEAGEYHKPIILPDYGATKEYFIDGYNAKEFRPKEATDLVQKIAELKENKKKLEILGENNFILSRTKHNFNDSKKKLLKFVGNIID